MSHATISPLSAKVYIIVLNWNGLADTIACIESVLLSDYRNFQLVVCDNASSDGSAAGIREWCAGSRSNQAALAPEFRGMAFPLNAARPALVEMRASELATSSGRAGPNDIVLIHTEGNLGYAGGNNCGIRFAQLRGDFSYLWLLNNDTIVKTNALSELVREIEHDDSCGMCGSTLLYYHEPSKIQTLGGGWFNSFTGGSGVFENGKSAAQLPLRADINRKLAFIAGASMLVRKSFCDDVGLMYEGYFLYFEELDWAVRGRSRYGLRWAPKSIVYHKEGASIGTGTHQDSSPVSLYYLFRNRIKFCQRHARLALPLALLTSIKVAARLAIAGYRTRAWLVLGATLGISDPPVSRAKAINPLSATK